MQTILHHRIDPSIRLLPAPKIAGLLPAVAGSPFGTYSTNSTDFHYTDPRLTALPAATRAQLLTAVEQLLGSSLEFLDNESGSARLLAALNEAGTQFTGKVKALSAAPVVEVVMSSPYRSREEMDEELREIAARMSERLATRYSAKRGTEQGGISWVM